MADTQANTETKKAKKPPAAKGGEAPKAKTPRVASDYVARLTHALRKGRAR